MNNYIQSDSMHMLQRSESLAHPIGARPMTASSSGATSLSVSRIALPILSTSKSDEAIARESLLSNDEIAQYSLLDCSLPDFFPQGYTLRNLMKFAVNFCAGGLSTGGEKPLDGLNSTDDLHFWETFLQNLAIHATETERSLFEELQQKVVALHENTKSLSQLHSSNLQPYSKTVMEKIIALPPGESLVFKGGYTNALGVDSHAEIYEFKKLECGHFELLIYTSTFHPLASFVEGSNKTVLIPLIRFTDIPQEHLFFFDGKEHRGAFVEALLYLASRIDLTERSAVDSTTISQTLLYLEKYRVPVSQGEVGVITPQRGGTCSPSVTKVWIRHHLRSTPLYKQLMFHAYLQMLPALFQKMGPHILSPYGEEEDRACEILRDIASKQQKWIKKVRGLVSEDKLFQAQATAEDLIRRLDLREAEINQKRQAQDTIDADVTVEGCLNSESKVSHTLKDMPRVIFNEETTTPPKLVIFDPTLQCNTKESLFRYFDRLEYSRVNDKPYKTFFLQLRHFFLNLPSPQLVQTDQPLSGSITDRIKCPPLDEMNHEELKRLSCRLAARQGDFSNLYEKKENHSVENFLLIANSFFVFLHYLYIRIEATKPTSSTPPNHAACLSSYPIVNPCRNELLKHLLLLDSEVLNKVMQLEAYVNDFNTAVLKNGSKEIFKDPWQANFSSDTLQADPKDPVKAILLEDKSLGQVLENILDLDPELKTLTENYLKTNPGPVYHHESVALLSTLHRFIISSLAGAVASSASKKAAIKISEYLTTHYHYINNMFYNLIFLKMDAKKIEELAKKQHPALARAIKKAGNVKRDRELAEVKFTEQRHKHRTALILTEAEIAPHQVLYEASQELITSEGKLNFCSRLLEYFFKLKDSSKSIKVTGADSLCKEPGLREAAKELITKGITRVKLSETEFKEVEIFLQFSFYCGKCLKDTGYIEEVNQFDLTKEIERWITSKKYPLETEAILRMYLVLFAQLRAIDCTNPDQTAPIFANNLFFRAANIQVPSFIQEEIDQQIRTFTHHVLTSIPTLSYARLGEKIIANLPLVHSPSGGKWDINPQLGPPYLKLGEWRIDLYGKMYTPQGQWTFENSRPSWEGDKKYKILFEEVKNLTYQKEGDRRFFCYHPAMGPLKIEKQGDKKVEIFRQFNGNWYSFIEESRLYSFPSALVERHSHWISAHETGERNLYITPKGDLGTPSHHVLPNGKIINLRNPHLSFSSAFHQYIGFDAWEEEKREEKHVFLAFGEPKKMDNITIVKDERTNQIIEIIFSDYFSEDGSPLRFVREGENLIWSENKNFILPKKIKQGAFFHHRNYLYLEHKDPSKKRSGVLLFRANAYLYLSYPYVRGKPVPTNLNSAVYLAYLYYRQGKYQDTMRLLNQIDSRKKLSKEIVQFLDLLLSAPLREDHPDAKMIKIHALRFLLNNLKLTEKNKNAYFVSFIDVQSEIEARSKDKKGIYFPLKEYEFSIIEIAENLIKAYSSETHHSFFLKMSKEERDELIKNIINSLSYCQSKFNSSHQEISEIIRQLKLITQPLRHLTVMPADQQIALFNRMNQGTPLPRKSDVTGFHSAMNRFHEIASSLISDISSLPILLPKGGSLLAFSSEMLLLVARDKNKWSKTDKQELLFRLMLLKAQAIRISSAELTQFDLAIAALFSEELGLGEYTPNENDFENCLSHNPESLFEKYLNIYEKINPTEFTNLINFYYFSDQVSEKPFPPLSKYFHFIAPQQEKKEIVLTEDSPMPGDPIPPPFEVDQKRWEQLKAWGGLFESAPQEISEFPLSFSQETLERYAVPETNRESLLQDFVSEEGIQKDYQIGQTINLERGKKGITPDNRERILKESQSEQEAVHEKILRKRTELLGLLNRQDDNPAIGITERATLLGNVEALLIFDDVIECILSGSKRRFSEKNPNLTPSEIERILSLSFEVLDASSYLAQLREIEKSCQKIGESTDPLVLEVETAKLAVHLEGKYHFEEFSPQEQMILYLFVGRSEILPYPKQMELLKKMLETTEVEGVEKYKKKVIQLIMGGGKTSVLATLFLEMAMIKEGKIGFFIVPEALFESVKANLSQSYAKAFGKRVFDLKLDRSQFTQFDLEKLLENLQKLKKNKEPVLVTATTLQELELEPLTLASEIAKIQETLKTKEDPKFASERIQLLTTMHELIQQGKLMEQILSEIRNCAEMLVDEVDQVMDVRQKVIVQTSEKTAVNPKIAEIIVKLVEYLSTDPEMKKITQIEHGLQSKVSSETYFKEIAPKLAGKMACEIELFDENPELISFLNEYPDSFIRYASNQMRGELQDAADQKESTHMDSHFTENDRQDIAFLKKLDTLGTSAGEDDREIANVLSYLKHFIIDLLPDTMEQVARVNYGSSPDTPGDVVNYDGVDTPAKTQIGYHWEKGFLLCFNALSSQMSPTILKEVAKITLRSAYYYAKRDEKALSDTLEYEKFEKIFGVLLDQLDHPGMIQKALETVAQSPEKILAIQYTLIGEFVKYSRERFESTGLCLEDLGNSFLTMSGTPRNLEGFSQELVEGFVCDLGTDGQVLHRFAEQIKDKKPIAIDFTSERDASNFFTQIREKYPDFDQISGIIDTAGEFKVYGSNLDIARKWMKDIRDPNIEAVLYFDADSGENQPNTLYAWKRGATCSERIGGTSEEVLSSKGLHPNNYVIFYDQRHTTGIDIKQKPNARNLLTFDSSIPMWALLQSIMRMRLFLFSQIVELLINSKTAHTLFENGTDPISLIYQAAIKQGIQKQEELILFFEQQIAHIFRAITARETHQALAEGDPEKIAKAVNTGGGYYISRTEENPYVQHGRLKRRRKTKDLLINMLEVKLKAFCEDIPDLDLLERARLSAKKLEAWIQRAVSLPLEMIERDGAENPTRIRTNERMAVRTHSQLKTRDQEAHRLKTAIDAYDINSSQGRERREKTITEKEFAALVAAKQKGESCDWVIPLQAQLASYPYTYNEDPLPLAKLFTQPISGTVDFFYSRQDAEGKPILLPIFHKSTKEAKQILAILNQNGLVQWVLVSEHQAGTIKKILKKAYESSNNPYRNVWLIQPDQSFLVSGIHMHLFPENGSQMGFFEINALEGNIAYFDNALHRSETMCWLSENSVAKMQFLKLRTHYCREKARLLKTSSAIASATGEKVIQQTVGGSFPISKERMKAERNQRGIWIPKTTEEVKRCTDPHKIRILHEDFVERLGINPKAEDSETMQALEQFASVPGSSTHVFDLEEHNRSIFANVVDYQVPHLKFWQVKYLPKSKYPYLSSPEQIKNGEEYLLGPEEINRLKSRNQGLIPGINPDYYVCFNNRWQIQNVPVQYLDKIRPEMFSLVSDPQVEGLIERAKQGDPELLRVAKICKEWMIDPQVAKLGIHDLAFMPKKSLQKITRDQIEAITDATLIPKLEEIAKEGDPPIKPGLWSSWICCAMVPSISSEQVPFMTERQIPLLTPSLVRTIDQFDQAMQLVPEAYQYLDPQFLSDLNDTQLLKLLAKGGIETIFPYLKKEGIKQFEEKCHLNCSAPDYFQALSSYVSHCDLSQVPYFSNNQLRALQLAPVEGWISEITDDQIGRFTEPSQVDVIPTERWKMLSERMIRNLGEEQVEAFGTTGYNRLEPTHPLWDRITTNVANQIQQNKIQYIKNKRLIVITKPVQLESLPSEKFVYLSHDQIRQIRPTMSGYILGVLTLGLAKCVASLFGFLVIQFMKEPAAKKWKKVLVLNFTRIKQLFTTVIPARIPSHLGFW
ncbi:MAG: hypothetical protein ACHQUC_02650 [Chlamydiales bacterium]